MMEILYVAHCVPWPPDKGERIRAFHSVSRLAEKYHVHLACIARSPNEAEAESELRGRLASVRIELLHVQQAIVRGFLGFARGGSFTTAFYGSPALQAHVRAVIASRPIKAVVLLSSATAFCAPTTIPFLADWGDVDSEKRLQYARMRFPGLPHRLEAQRLRQDERNYALRAQRTFLTTPNELKLFSEIAPGAVLSCSGNGVDAAFFNPNATPDVPMELTTRKYLVFVGVLDYFPNVDGVRWFVEDVFPMLRRQDPGLELILVGRHPTREVITLGRREGVTVTGAVDDVRAYLAASHAVIAPLRLARGVQNKVLEALAMGKRVLASEEVCRTFAPDLPLGLECCRSATDYAHAFARLPGVRQPDWSVAEAARLRFCWSSNLAPIIAELDKIERDTEAIAA